MNRRWIIICLTLFSLLAFSVRLAFDVHFKAWKSPAAMEHKSIAQALVHGKGFTFGDWGYYGPTSVQSPPFPFLLAGMYKIFGSQAPADGSLHGANLAYFSIMILNAIAGAALVWLTYTMTRTLGGTPLAGLIAAGLVALWPTQIYAARFVQAVSMITCGLAGVIILYYRAVRTGKVGPWMGYSFLAAIVTLTEPVFLPALLLSGILVLLTPTLSWESRFRNLAILAFAVFSVIGPWATRNYIVHGKLIPVKGSFWVNVWKGNNDYATGSDRLALTRTQKDRFKKHVSTKDDDDIPDSAHVRDMLDPKQIGELSNQPETIREVRFKDYTTKWIAKNPKRFLQLCGIRIAKSLTIDWDNPRAYLSPSYLVSRIAILTLTLAGLVVAIRNRWSLAMPAILAFTALASYTVTVAAARFAFPFEPIQLAIGAGFLAMLLPDPDRAPPSGGRGFHPLMPEKTVLLSH